MTLREIEREVRRLAAVIDAPDSLLPTYGTSDQTARPHIEVDARGLHYVICERGTEWERHTVDDLDTLLQHVFASVTFSMGVNHEVTHRKPLKDARRMIWAHQLSLLETLSPAWADAEQKRIHEILEDHPFDDLSILRMRITRNLREGGIDADEAWDRACELIPLPK